ncbi:MAG: tyrosine--tRNA ligase [Microgenomates group bacterium]|nr:tyrosine--tRNA ligase [Microgenomates group bacterium]
MTTQDRLNLIKQVGEEIVTEAELVKLLENEEELVAYDGFEPSGQMHIAQGLFRAINVNKMIKAGVRFKMLVADWHAMANNKMEGDLEKIQTVGRYFIEVWKACGMDLKNVEFVWASDLVKNPKYWELVIKVGRSNALRRFIRTAEIMGREESLDKLTGAMIIYSCMQVADIFYLGAKICQLGMDQRKVNMLAREIGLQLDPPTGGWKPVVVSHHMLMGLNSSVGKLDTVFSDRLTPKGPQAIVSKKVSSLSKTEKVIALKMSKSHPDSAIFMTDTKEDIERKINKAYCPEGVLDENPILEYYKYIIFESLDRLKINHIVIERPQKFGGNVTLNSFQDLERKFVNKEIHPLDLKTTAVNLIDRLIAPVRRHFEENPEARELLKKVRSYQVTR